MNKSLWISATGMAAQQTMTDTIANNMANVNTTGYKRSVARFQDMLYDTLSSPGSETADAEAPVGIQVGSGVRTVSVSKDFGQGSLNASSSPLDLAIEGDGFFEVSMPDGTSAYTRAGNFHRDATGQVVTAEGYPVVGFPSIDTSATGIDIAPDGTVSIQADGSTSSSGRIQLVRFANPEGLRNIGHNLLGETEASGGPARGNPGDSGYGAVAQFHLEGSNVEIVREMVDMIAAQRAYELNSKSIKTADEMLQMASNLK